MGHANEHGIQPIPPQKMSEEKERGWRWEDAREKKWSRAGWAVCIDDVCVLSVEQHCTVSPVKTAQVHIWGTYDLGARTWQTGILCCAALPKHSSKG